MASQIKAKVIRVVRTDNCGNPVPGPTGQVVSAGFTMVSAKAQTQAGKEFYVQNAWGDPCINDLDCDRLKRYDLELDMCDINPAVIEIMTGYRLITDAATPPNIIGFAVDESPGSCNAGFQLELWTKVSGGACGTGGYQWAHWVFPFARYGELGDWTFQLDSLTATVTASSQHSSVYGAGPFAQWAPSIEPTEHVAMQYSNVAPPADTNGYAALATATPVAA
jgi:hypothetical protein